MNNKLTEQQQLINGLINDVMVEFNLAECMHGAYNSAHEAYAVILEELDEFWDEVRLKTNQRSPQRMRSELIQIAVTALRAVKDLNL